MSVCKTTLQREKEREREKRERKIKRKRKMKEESNIPDIFRERRETETEERGGSRGRAGKEKARKEERMSLTFPL